jgi:hypothetical protein
VCLDVGLLFWHGRSWHLLGRGGEYMLEVVSQRRVLISSSIEVREL